MKMAHKLYMTCKMVGIQECQAGPAPTGYFVRFPTAVVTFEEVFRAMTCLREVEGVREVQPSGGWEVAMMLAQREHNPIVELYVDADHDL